MGQPNSRGVGVHKMLVQRGTRGHPPIPGGANSCVARSSRPVIRGQASSCSRMKRSQIACYGWRGQMGCTHQESAQPRHPPDGWSWHVPGSEARASPARPCRARAAPGPPAGDGERYVPDSARWETRQECRPRRAGWQRDPGHNWVSCLVTRATVGLQCVAAARRCYSREVAA